MCPIAYRPTPFSGQPEVSENLAREQRQQGRRLWFYACALFGLVLAAAIYVG